MDNISKVIFTCLAIGYTFLIYQNNELKKDIDGALEMQYTLTLEDRETLDELAELIEVNQSQLEGIRALYLMQDSQIKLLETNVDIAFKNFDVTKEGVGGLNDWTQTTAETINAMQDNIMINADRIDKVVEYLRKYP